MVKPDPFVLQTYKSTMCFLTSWIVLLLGVDFEFTPWGIVSGLIWVSGGTCGIFGIRNAGLAISVGTWSAVTVLVSFAWGIFVFGEQVQSVSSTLFGVLMMIVGFIGMAYFSAPEAEENENENENENDGSSVSDNQFACIETETEAFSELANDNDLTEPLLDNNDNAHDEEAHESERADPSTKINEVQENKNTIMFMGMKCDRKKLGILGAAVDGLMGGSTLIPMKLAPSM